jgi:SAM-dependent methyltransferase
MGRGPLAAGGTAYYADLVVDALDLLGIDLDAGLRGLDFGCSSGRVVRVLAAAYPNVEWHGCDPIESSITWAKANLKGIRFEVSPQDPPLPYEEGVFDFVFAISIWSHFAEAAALRWFWEMRRLIRPGGVLVLTTHGPHSISHHARKGDRSIEQLARIGRSLYSDGYWFSPEFGETGDHGIVNPEWGTAFWTVEWLAANICPDWHIAACMPGRAEDNQDAIVLERT